MEIEDFCSEQLSLLANRSTYQIIQGYDNPKMGDEHLSIIRDNLDLIKKYINNYKISLSLAVVKDLKELGHSFEGKLNKNNVVEYINTNKVQIEDMINSHLDNGENDKLSNLKNNYIILDSINTVKTGFITGSCSYMYYMVLTH